MPSLTLNNPDMILPFNGSERESQTPSPPTQLVYLTNLNARYNSSNSTLQAPPNATGARKKNFSRHAWSHEDLNASRRLSDIGEELSPTRVGGFEDGPGPGPGPGPGHKSGPGSGSGSSFVKQTIVNPPVRRDSLPRSGHRRNVPSNSSSTYSAGSTRAPSSTEVSPPLNTQGSSPNPAERTETPSNDEAPTTSLPESSAIVSAAKEKGPGDEFSSAILSSEAERILENAKKRLTVGDTQGIAIRNLTDLSRS